MMIYKFHNFWQNNIQWKHKDVCVEGSQNQLFIDITDKKCFRRRDCIFLINIFVFVYHWE